MRIAAPKTSWSVAVCILMTLCLHGQSPDETDPPVSVEAFETEEPVSPDSQPGYPASESLTEMSLRPVNVNSEEISELLDAGLISEYQFQTLTEYRYRYGAMATVFELGYVEGWDIATVQRVLPFIRVGTLPAGPLKPGDIFRRIEQDLVISTGSTLQKSKGYLSGDTVNSGPHYTGSPVRLALRYDLQYPGKFRIGLRAEKDPGEKILVPAGHSGRARLPDHLSAFIQLTDIGLIKSFCLGDYQAVFGQGLLIGCSSMKSGSLTGVIRSVDGIKPHTSLNERYFYRGAGLTAEFGKFSLTGFYSGKKLDPTGITYDSIGLKALSFKSVSATGLHRTAGELDLKQRLKETVAGAFAVYKGKWLKTGFGIILPVYGLPQIARDDPYAKYSSLEGKQWLASGELQLMFRRMHLAAEVAFGMAMPPTWVVKAVAMLSDGLKLGLGMRHYPAGFYNPFGTGFSSGSANRNETGFWMGWEAELPFRTSLYLDADMARHDWLTYGSDAPAYSQVISARMTNCLNPSFTFLVSGSFRRVIGTYRDEYQYTEKESSGERYSLRFQGGYRLNDRSEVRTAVHYICHRTGTGEISRGSAISADLNLRPGNLPVRIWFRTCIFGTDDYDSRISMYENGPLYDFTGMTIYGKGWRTAIMLTWSPLPWLDLWLKLSQSTYPGQKSIGSGWDEIPGNRKTAIELQTRLKW